MLSNASQNWVSATTYIQSKGGFLYLATLVIYMTEK